MTILTMTVLFSIENTSLSWIFNFKDMEAITAGFKNSSEKENPV